MLSVLKLYVSRNQSLISMVIFFICHIFGVPKMAHQFPFKIFLPSPESMATGRAGFMGVQPEQSHRTRTQKGPGLGLMLCCRYLEILINFWTRGPTNYVASLGYGMVTSRDSSFKDLKAQDQSYNSCGPVPGREGGARLPLPQRLEMDKPAPSRFCSLPEILSLESLGNSGVI